MASNVFQVLSFNANAAYTGEAIDCEHSVTLSLQLVGTGLDKADGTVKLQYSNDNTSFADVAAATTVAAGATVTIIPLTSVPCRYYRVVWAKGTNAAGTLVAKLFGKSK